MIDQMGAGPRAPVVVGADGSPEAVAAVRMAAREAASRGRALRIVHAVDRPPAALASTLGWTAPPDAVYRQRAGGLVARAVDAARGVDADLEISTAVTAGDAAPVLLAENRRAALIVAGHRGARSHGLLIGSVAERIATLSAAPVVIARGRPHPDGPVVAGVDEQQEGRVLAEAVAGLAERHPDLPIHDVVRQRPARRTPRDSSHAQLIVIGERGHGGFASLLLGSVSRYLPVRAGCPNAVIRPVLVTAQSSDNPRR